MRTMITNGTVVNTTGRVAADLLIDGETVAAVLAPGTELLGSDTRSSVDTVINVAGKYVILGGVDAHTHMGMPFGGTNASDTFEMGARAAARRHDNHRGLHYPVPSSARARPVPPVARDVEVTSTTPARMFGMYGRKGVIQPGADADIVVYDPNGHTTISAATHHMNLDYSAREGFEIDGRSTPCSAAAR